MKGMATGTRRIDRVRRWLRIVCACVQVLLGASSMRVAAAEQPAGSTAQTVAAAKQLLASDADSALTLVQQAVRRMDPQTAVEEQGALLLVLGDACLATGDPPAALSAYHRGQVLVEGALKERPGNAALVLLHADLQIQAGHLHYTLGDYDKSVAYYTQALRILDGPHDEIPVAETSLRKVRAFNNLGGIYLQRSDHVSALPYFQQAMEMNRPLNNPANESSLANNIGICHMEMGQREQADQYFLRALALRKLAGDTGGQAQVLNNLGKNQVLADHFSEARSRYEEALVLGRSASNGRSMLVSLESLSSLYDTLGEYKAAVRAFRAFKQLSDSLNNMENRATIARMEFDYRRERERKAAELESQRKDQAHARQQAMNTALVVALLLLLLIGFLVFKVMRARVRTGRLEQDKLRLEREKLGAEQAALQESLEARDRELAANALFLLKKNEIISNIAERLLKARSTFRQENQQVVLEIVRDLNASKDEASWQEFEAHFTRVHGSFYQHLQERFPALTPNERKLCAFLRLNLSTKDISAITHQSPNSITVARSCLRKKLQIEGEEVNLVDFLQAL